MKVETPKSDRLLGNYVYKALVINPDIVSSGHGQTCVLGRGLSGNWIFSGRGLAERSRSLSDKK